MFISLSWLKDFIDLPKNLNPNELGRLLTIHTVEVDGVFKEADKFANIVVGKILEIKKHPQADRLQLVKVDIGKRVLDIVCGASNIQVNQIVPVALIDAVLPGNFKIEETVIRGEKSQGMLCSQKELGLGDDHAGILLLDSGAIIGQDLAEYLKLSDAIYEIDNKSLTNRPDLWGHYGIAREIAAFLNLKLKEQTSNFKFIPQQAELENKIESKILKVEVASDFCRRYCALAIDNIKVQKSPAWLEKRLIACGVRPINNIVDITNYVMLEIGQPMHAFDWEKITNQNNETQIKIRQAKNQEKFIALGGEVFELSTDALVIANNEKILALAGIIGGNDSGISEETTSVVLESANFNSINIRKTSQKNNLRTESSVRFEKDLDLTQCKIAIQKAVELILEVCPEAKIESDLINLQKDELIENNLEIEFSWLWKRLGEKLEKSQVIQFLENLGYKIQAQDSKKLIITIPSWRNKDTKIKEDILEDIARLYGYDKLLLELPKTAPINFTNENWKLEKKIKTILIGAPALTEVYNYSFVGDVQLQKLGLNLSDYLCLAKPLTDYQTKLRRSLATNLLNTVKNNQAKLEKIKIFELGTVYLDTSGNIEKNHNTENDFLPYQEKRIGILITGKDQAEIFAEVKGVGDYLLQNFKLKTNWHILQSVPVWAESKISASLFIDKQEIGFITCLKEKIAKDLGIKTQVAILEIRLPILEEIILKSPEHKVQIQEKYPSAIRDLAFVINKKILYTEIKDTIQENNPFLKELEVFDIYEGAPLQNNEKSLAFHLIYQANRTLTNEEVDQFQADIIKKMEEKFEAKIRNF